MREPPGHGNCRAVNSSGSMAAGADGAATDGRLRPSRLETENSKTRTRGERGPVTANHDRSARPACAGNMLTGHRPGTPRPMRTRVTTTDGRFPGSRVAAFDHLPRDGPQWLLWPSARRLQLRGQLRNCTPDNDRSMRTAFPWLALAGTTIKRIAPDTVEVNSRVGLSALTPTRHPVSRTRLANGFKHLRSRTMRCQLCYDPACGALRRRSIMNSARGSANCSPGVAMCAVSGRIRFRQECWIAFWKSPAARHRLD